jgi:hypothetical protein
MESTRDGMQLASSSLVLLQSQTSSPSKARRITVTSRLHEDSIVRQPIAVSAARVCMTNKSQIASLSNHEAEKEID